MDNSVGNIYSLSMIKILIWFAALALAVKFTASGGDLFGVLAVIGVIAAWPKFISEEDEATFFGMGLVAMVGFAVFGVVRFAVG